MVNKVELSNVFKSTGEELSDSDMKKLLSHIGADNSSSVDFNQFLKMMAKRAQDNAPEQELREAFKLFDKDGHGFVSASEMRHLVTNRGERLTEEEADEFIKEADIDGDGQINYEEFLKMMLSK